MDLYTENILDHYHHPRNKGRLSDSTLSAEDANPLCGDMIRIDLRLDDSQRVEDVRFESEGCAISQACASMLTEVIVGKSLNELQNIKNGEILQMLGIPIGPARTKCALLSLVVLKKALKKERK